VNFKVQILPVRGAKSRSRYANVITSRFSNNFKSPRVRDFTKNFEQIEE